ncbi:hypothetical protein INT45_008095, partial [Circinella minor]
MEELAELRSSGDPVLRRIPAELKPKFNEIESLKTALDAYNYGRAIDHHPIDQPLLAWLSQTLMQTAKFFIPGASTPVKNFLESDQLYYLWSMVNTIHHNSNIEALEKEKSSTSNAAVLNSKRKLSAVQEIEREKMDAMLKLPFVLKDMLTEIVNCRPSLLRKAHVIGYNVNGNSIRLIDADLPDGHIIRLRRTDKLEYPMTNDDYVLKILSLLELAAYGKVIIDDTYTLCCETRAPPRVGGGSSLVTPTFMPTNDNQDSSFSSSSKRAKKG